MRYRLRVPFVMKLPSHLSKSRYGIYYLRIERNGVEKRRMEIAKDVKRVSFFESNMDIQSRYPTN